MHLSQDHKRTITDVIRTMRGIPNDESSFVKLEILYYDVLTLSRMYGNNINENAMLAGLKQLEGNEYKHAQERFKRSNQKTIAIQKFKNALKKVLSSWIEVESIKG